jgi:pilus assembly protein CpaF
MNVTVPYTFAGIQVREALPYPDILESVQKHISSTHAQLANKTDMTPEDVYLFKRLVREYLEEENMVSADMDIETLLERIYRDMMREGILTPYLEQETIDQLGLEEIRINSWNSIYLITSKQGKVRLKERFASPKQAETIIARMLQKSHMIIDDGLPYALGHLGKNQRIAAFKTPILDAEIGIMATIRIVSFSKLTRQNLIDWNTATLEMLDFLELCVGHGISVCLSGATGSGKTGTLGYLLAQLTGDDKTRVITMEEGSREFDLIREDENGVVMNDVVHLLTRKSDNEKNNVSQNTLLEQILRHTPDVIGIGEMRSVEAYTAIEAAYTDHTIGTTTHAMSAADTYDRMVMLAAKGTSSFSEESLFRKAIAAFPIIVYQLQYPDGKRRMQEIMEGIGYRDGKVEYNVLYRFRLDETLPDGTVIGEFEKVNPISQRLQTRLAEHGVAKDTLERFVRGADL